MLPASSWRTLYHTRQSAWRGVGSGAVVRDGSIGGRAEQSSLGRHGISSLPESRTPQRGGLNESHSASVAHVGVVSSLGILNAVAQTTAQINGTVVDESGAVLPGVAVAALQTDTGFRRDAVTDTTGSYTLTNLPIGPYRLEVTLAGFRTYVQTGIVLQVNSNPVIPVKLQLGALEETVSVEAATPLVETRNPAIGAVIDNEAVEALPLEGRNVASLVVLAGGAVDTGNPSSRSLTQSRGIAVAGGQQFGVQYLLDGAMHNNWYDGVNLPLPFPDAMQEIRVETSSQNAQNGVKAGGTVSVATKAGTNLYRGDLFEFARHHRFNAKAPFAAVESDHRRARQRWPRAKPVRWRAGRPDRPGQDLFLRRVSGHAHDADAS